MTFRVRSSDVRCTRLVILAFAALIACAKTESARDTTRTDTATRATAMTGASTPEMPETFDQISGQALHDYIGKLVFDKNGQNNRQRKCKHDPQKCPDANSTTSITITPEQGAKDLGSKDATGYVITLPNDAASKGYIIALLKNDGNAEEEWLGLSPGDEAYWLIEPAPGGGVRSRFIQLHAGAKDSWDKGELTHPGTLVFSGCNHKPKPKVEADFGECPDHKGPDDTARTGAPNEANRGHGRIPGTDVESTWITCVAGCCTASAGAAGQVPCKGKDCPPPCTGKGCPDSATKRATKAATKRPAKS